MSNTLKIKSSTLTVQLISVCIILLSYYTTKMLSIFAGIVCAIFLLSRVDWTQKYSLIYFLFPFASVFTLASGKTSVFMVLRIAIIMSALLYEFKKITPKIITASLSFVVYCLIVSFSNDIIFLMRLGNITIWIFVIYFMQTYISEKNSICISRSISNGTIIASCIGLNIDKIPGIVEEIGKIGLYYGGEVTRSRLTGLFSDPNLYTLLLCVCLWAIYFEFSKNRIGLTEFLARNLAITFFGAITFSKSCILIVAVFWLYVLLSRNNIKFIYKVIVVSVFIFGVCYFLVINSEWLDIMFSRFTKKNGSSAVNINTLTTGRFELWKVYLGFMGTNDSWVFGNGLSNMLPYGRAAHNMILQCLYCIGVVGSMVYINYFRTVYKVTPDMLRIKGINRVGVMMLLSVFAISFFLDLLLLEIFYYMVSLCFVFMKRVE